MNYSEMLFFLIIKTWNILIKIVEKNKIFIIDLIVYIQSFMILLFIRFIYDKYKYLYFEVNNFNLRYIM